MGSIPHHDRAEGFTVVHDPERATVDIVFVHGLGGHPYHTWACARSPARTPAVRDVVSHEDHSASDNEGCFGHVLRRLGFGSEKHKNKSSGDASPNYELGSREGDEAVNSPEQSSTVFWPHDFLAQDANCKEARILVYGYDSRTSKGFESVNQNGFFAHAKDLLYSLQREKPGRRPVIFVAHSLGGLLVKEVLRRSEASEEDEIKDIVRSTRGVIFLGTPHRGSPGMASLGETVRSIASTILRIDSNAALLRALGADSPELELGRESFLTLWRQYGFRVKTFQEAWGISGVNVGPLNEKVVPDVSSTLDDPREHAETISANHMNMCRYGDKRDSGYRKVASEIGSFVTKSQGRLNDHGRAFLKSLAFEEMDSRRQNIQQALDTTCGWLYDTGPYVDWVQRNELSTHHGILWIKGKPGSGKSTLMKDALRRAEELHLGNQTTVAGFFFNARGKKVLEKSPLGLYRSLLYQVLRQDELAAVHLTDKYKVKAMLEGSSLLWHQEELQDLLRRVFATSQSRPATLFIDAMDECNDDEVRGLVRFFKSLAKKAVEVGAQLSVCFSSRHYPHISIDNCLEVVMEGNNREDILLYIKTEAEDNRPIAELRNEIFDKSSGVFLWVVLATAMLQQSGRGRSLKWLRQKLEEIPPELDALFRNIFSRKDASCPEETAAQTVCLMQLVLFSKEPLTLDQIHQALAFSKTAYPSMAAWKESVEYLETTAQRKELVLDLSRGLLEEAPSSVAARQTEATKRQPTIRGSVTYQFIHETVREFFMKGDGFKLLHFEPDNLAGASHAMMATFCVNLLLTKDFSLVSSQAKPDRATTLGSDFILLDYISGYLFDHMEGAVENGRPQAEHITQLAAEACHPLCCLSSLQRKTRFNPGSTILMAAVGFGSIHIARTILSMGYNVNQLSGTAHGYALHAAVAGPLDSHLIDSLVPGEKTMTHNSPQVAMVDLLLSHGADISLANVFGQTPLHIAATKSAKLVTMLLERHPYVNARDAEGETPLHRAFYSSEYDAIASLLLQHGASQTIMDRRGRTPAGLAREREEKYSRASSAHIK